ncbi:hypothetical protein DSO57_1030699 [Entomophthora muscae]|uniref:Uncharacterized protein n=1 Tax=Entomophthora muscae TaxID=34485 RepID=A0ACC2SDS1_9FUNG|nr:hypothetical protein DSO57_1030699 [Entomophthora muscae]
MHLGLILLSGSFLANALPSESHIMKIPKRRTSTRKSTKNPDPPSIEAEPKRLAHYAGMAYCSKKTVEDKTCGPCKSISKDVVVGDVVESSLDGHALILVHHQRKEVIVSVRGLITWENGLNSLKTWKKPINTFSYQNNVRLAGTSDTQVHKGFKNTADSISELLNPKLNRLLSKHSDYRLQLVGHSLGGAVATLLSIGINQELRIPYERMNLTTYGQPRVGNAAFAQWFNSLPLAMTRVVNENDPVPHIPLILNGFHHTKTELYIHNGQSKLCPPPSNSVLEDEGCSGGRTIKFGLDPHLIAWDVPLQKESC